MQEKQLPFDAEKLVDIVANHPTPFHLYDEKGIRSTARELNNAFSWAPGGFINYFAVKALPNPHILSILRDEGMGADCSSLPELLIAKAVGLQDEEILFTSNDTPAQEYSKAYEIGALINLDDISHISFLEENAGIPETICLRYNPGPLKEGNSIIGKPQESKYGFTREHLFEGYRRLKGCGAKKFGLHTMVASNELNPDYFVETAAILFELVVALSEEVGIEIAFVNLGGGIGIPYRPEQGRLNLYELGERISRLYRDKIESAGIPPLKIMMECGRVVTGPHGHLVTRVRHRKETYKTFIGLDANMANLMRPAIYGAYHHISLPGVTGRSEEVCDVTGSLCENNDKFAIDRTLPRAEPGDLLVIHDTGAHGHAMGFNYNGKLRGAELLLREDGTVAEIRRAETLADHFSTLDFPGL